MTPRVLITAVAGVRATAADVIACDVGDERAVLRAVGEAVERLGGLEALRDDARRVIDVRLPAGPAAPTLRGLAAYSDALRAEHGCRLLVTMVSPGQLRAAIAPLRAAGAGWLEGAVPVERVLHATRALALAAPA